MRPTNATLSFAAASPFARPASLPPRYVLDDLLAQGGQGAVYAGHDTVADKPVAVKVLPPDDPSSVGRMNREVSALRLLDIPGVVRLIDSGGDDQYAWIVMERVDGVCFPAGRHTWEQLRPVVAGLLHTLARVHDVGLLHRDIKPGNVLVDPAGRSVLLDFGLVRGVLAGPTITRTGAVMGTPMYMSPEQVRGDRADRRSDLYALGAMIREALTGQVPFYSEHIAVMFEARLRGNPPTILSLRPELPPEVVTLLDALVARRPESRPTSARAALGMLRGEAPTDLLPWIGGRDAVDALVSAAGNGESVTLVGPRGSGRTRTLREAARALGARGRRVRWVAPADDPLGSLRRLLGEPEPDDPDPVATMLARLGTVVGTHDVLLVDDWEGVDGWSRSLLLRAPCVVLTASLPVGVTPVRRSLPPMFASEGALRVAATLRPLVEIELMPIFGGAERLLHLPSDSAALLLRRTGGLVARVVSEIQRWLDAGLALLVDGRVRLTRASLDRIAGGFAGPAVSEIMDEALPPDLDELLAWVHLAGPACTIQRLATARGEPVWRLDLALRQLESLGAVARSGGVIEPIQPASALLSWQNDVRMAVHEALAKALPPGASGRMYHFVALGDARGAVDDACALAQRLVDDARLPEAMAALEEAGRLALATGVQARELWKRVAALAILEGTRPVLVSAAELLDRSEAEPALGRIVSAALSLVSGGRERAVASILDTEEQDDPEIERLRWEVRVQLGRGEGGAAYASVVEDASAWANRVGTSEARAARADWRSSWLYQTGAIREAADEAEAGALLPQPLGGRMRLMLRAISCLVLIAEVDRALGLGRELGALARERRLPKMEAYSEWVPRHVANLLRMPTEIDEELIVAVGEIGAPDVAGLILVNEAVIAWWSGDPARGEAIAATAERAFVEAGAAASLIWARAVRIACAPDAVEAGTCAADAVETGRQDVILQVLGVLKLSGGLTGDWSRELGPALEAVRPFGYDEWPRGALAPGEVARAFSNTPVAVRSDDPLASG